MATWVAQHSDSFNRTNTGDIDGSTMTGSAGTWSRRVGTNAIGITSNQAVGTVASRTVYYDSSVAAFGDQRASLKLVDGEFGGPAVRVQADGSGYYVMGRTVGSVELYRDDAGTQTSLGTAAASAAGDTLTVEAVGTTVTAYKNGTAIITVTGQSSYATGRPGIYSGTTRTYDDWASFTALSGSGVDRQTDPFEHPFRQSIAPSEFIGGNDP